MDTHSPRITRLIDLAGTYHIGIDETQAFLLLKHLDLVRLKNSEVNLTAITDVDEGLIKHVLDSLLFLSALQQQCVAWGNFVDIGTGAGFPGIPLGIVTGSKGTLIDSVAKKTNAVNGFISSLGLTNLNCVHIRAEELTRGSSKNTDLVVARAVAHLGILIEYATPLLRSGGYLVASKGNMSSEELEQAQICAEKCGMTPVSHETYTLPDSCGNRSIYLFEQCTEPTVKLPRRVGMARKRPLWA